MNRITKSVSKISFYLFIPGFLLYYIIVTFGIGIPFLGNYLGIIGGLLIIPNMICYLISKKFNLLDLVFIFWHIIIGLYSIYCYSIGIVSNNFELLNWSLGSIVFNILMYFISANINYLYYSKSIIVIYYIINILVLVSTIMGKFFINLSGVSGFSLNYQDFAVLYTIFSSIIIYKYKNPINIIMSLVILYFNGARTEFAIFVITVVLVKMFVYVKNGKYLKLLSAIVIMLIFTRFFLLIIKTIDSYSRMASLLNLQNDASSLYRTELLKVAMSTISNNPIWGNYGSYVILNGGIGTNAHNILSAWVNFGLIGFLFYLACPIYILFKTYHCCKETTYLYKTILFLAIFITMAFIMSKSYNYIMFGFLLGISNYFITNKKEEFV